MTDFTAGPWLVMPAEADKPYLRIRGTRLGGRYKVANVMAAHDGAYEWQHAETLANAHLMSAAPDLLEALRVVLQMDVNGHELQDRLHFSPLGRTIFAQVSCAIAKATGEEI